MDFRTFCNLLNESKWRGVITEIGMGLPFSSRYLNVPGASATIENVASPYSKDVQDLEDVRSVSKEGVEQLITRGFNTLPIYRNDGVRIKRNVFSLVISASHKTSKERGASHGWIGLVAHESGEDENNDSFQGVLHFSLNKDVFANREAAGRFYAEKLIPGFICLTLGIGELTLEEYIEDLKAEGLGERFRIDVLNIANVSNLNNVLELVCKGNPVIISPDITLEAVSTKLNRVEDALRKRSRIYRGSFNPPTKAHAEIGEDALYEISMENAWKGRLSHEDIAHRVMMLASLGKTVMVSADAPYFVDLDNLLQTITPSTYEYVVGTDLFNAICDEKYIFGKDYLKPFYTDGGRSKFLLFKREGYTLVDNEYSALLNWSGNIETEVSNISSTEVRNGNLKLCNPIVADYIKDNNLYGINPEGREVSDLGVYVVPRKWILSDKNRWQNALESASSSNSISVLNTFNVWPLLNLARVVGTNSADKYDSAYSEVERFGVDACTVAHHIMFHTEPQDIPDKEIRRATMSIRDVSGLSLKEPLDVLKALAPDCFYITENYELDLNKASVARGICVLIDSEFEMTRNSVGNLARRLSRFYGQNLIVLMDGDLAQEFRCDYGGICADNGVGITAFDDIAYWNALSDKWDEILSR